jgi:hypothetical protein
LTTMNLKQVKEEIRDLGSSPVAGRMYPITSDWVPITDVLAILNRFEKHWKKYQEGEKSEAETKLVNEILGVA